MGVGAEGEVITADDAQLLPNPATDVVRVRVHTQGGGAATIKIFSATGALVHTDEMPNTAHGELTVPISQLGAGIYNVEIKTESGNLMIRQLMKR